MNKGQLIALRKRLHEVSHFDLVFDDYSNITRKEDYGYIEIDEVCESIGIDKSSAFVDTVVNNYNDIADMLSDSVMGESIVGMVLGGYFGIAPSHLFAPRYKLLYRVEDLARDICKSMSVELTEETLKKVLAARYYDDDDANLVMFEFKDDDNTTYSLSLHTILKRALLTTEAVYEVVEWIDDQL